MTGRQHQVTSRQVALLQQVMSSPARHVIGIDEVGYGSWAGPLYVAGAVFLKGWGDPAVKDSKAYANSAARHRVLVTKVLPAIVHHVICIATSEEIDAEGVAVVLGRLTHTVAFSCLAVIPNSVVVGDGDRPLNIPGVETYVLPKADSLVPAVAAASIIAKTARDEAMELFAKKHPGYAFEKNRGYHSADHADAIHRLGVCAIHRKSYRPIKQFLESGTLVS
jgi:ribonuclease HII